MPLVAITKVNWNATAHVQLVVASLVKPPAFCHSIKQLIGYFFKPCTFLQELHRESSCYISHVTMVHIFSYDTKTLSQLR
jgi:hypothetical protein